MTKDKQNNFESTLKQYNNQTIAIGKDFNKNDGTLNVIKR